MLQSRQLSVLLNLIFMHASSSSRYIDSCLLLFIFSIWSPSWGHCTTTTIQQACSPYFGQMCRLPRIIRLLIWKSDVVLIHYYAAHVNWDRSLLLSLLGLNAMYLFKDEGDITVIQQLVSLYNQGTFMLCVQKWWYFDSVRYYILTLSSIFCRFQCFIARRCESNWCGSSDKMLPCKPPRAPDNIWALQWD